MNDQPTAAHDQKLAGFIEQYQQTNDPIGPGPIARRLGKIAKSIPIPRNLITIQALRHDSFHREPGQLYPRLVACDDCGSTVDTLKKCPVKVAGKTVYFCVPCLESAKAAALAGK